MRNSVFAAAAIFLSAGAVSPSTPAEYRERIELGRELTVELIADLVEGRTTESGADFDAEKVVRIRKLLPASEIIRTENGEIEVSNKWLHSRLDEFVTESTFMTRGSLLSDIEERLAAISWKITQTETAAKSGQSKTEERQKLDEILAREEFRGSNQKDQSLVQRLIDWVLDLIDRIFSGVRPDVSQKPSVMPMADGIRAVLLLILIGIIGFALYKFSPFIFPKRWRKKAGEGEDRVILGERIGAEATAADLLAEAESLANLGDLRGAIRKAYIALLLALNDAGLIRLASHKTNRDYLRDLRGRGDLQNMMNALTLSFERHWYGLQPAEKNAWEEFRLCFSAIAKQAGAKDE